MSPHRAVRRVVSMDGREVAFRIQSEGRKRMDRLRVAVAPPRWHRNVFPGLLDRGTRVDSLELARCRATAGRADWMEAHRAFAAHISTRRSPFPLDSSALQPLAAHIGRQFPSAAPEAAAAADRILAGTYDLLGYTALDYGSPPRWHDDPVHGRTAPGGFWASIPYLDPATGDHKIIWEINRHQYFLSLARAYHLTGQNRYYRAFVEHLTDWLDANPPLQGVNWSSMLELAFRALSWMWALHLFAPAVARDDGGTAWTVDLVVALDRQLAHVEHNLSRYFSPNTHLSGEALALYVAGLSLPELRSAGRRRTAGGDVLVTEAARQVRPDGGHAELSAHYHRYSTDFYLLAFNVAQAAGDHREAPLRESASRQAEYLRAIADDAGRLPLIGDDDGGQLFPICGRRPFDCRDTLAAAAMLLEDRDLQVEATPEEVYWLCGSRVGVEQLDRAALARSPQASIGFPDTGYYVIRGRPGDQLVFDAGPHGFLNGGHAHADALSIVLTTGGLPLLVDPGTATYTMDPGLRDLFRSTAMHNTVVVNGVPQSAPQGPFHWRTRANARAPIWRPESAFTYVEGQHDGYAPIVHARGILAIPSLGWIVIDHLLGAGAARSDTHWHLHPDWTVVSRERGCVTLEHLSGRLATLAASSQLDALGGGAAGGLDMYAPEYGRIERGSTLRMHLEGALPRTTATFIPAAAVQGHVEAVALAVTLDAGWHTAAFRITAGCLQAELLCAVESDGAVGQVTGDPGRVWGTPATRTDARVALAGADITPIALGGSRLVTSLASAVHQSSAGR